MAMESAEHLAGYPGVGHDEGSQESARVRKGTPPELRRREWPAAEFRDAPVCSRKGCAFSRV